MQQHNTTSQVMIIKTKFVVVVFIYLYTVHAVIMLSQHPCWSTFWQLYSVWVALSKEHWNAWKICHRIKYLFKTTVVRTWTRWMGMWCITIIHLTFNDTDFNVQIIQGRSKSLVWRNLKISAKLFGDIQSAMRVKISKTRERWHADIKVIQWPALNTFQEQWCQHIYIYIITSMLASSINLIGSSILILLYIAITNARRKNISHIHLTCQIFILQISFWSDSLTLHHLFVLVELFYLFITAEYLIFTNTLSDFEVYILTISRTFRKSLQRTDQIDLWYSNQLISVNANSTHWF